MFERQLTAIFETPDYVIHILDFKTFFIGYWMKCGETGSRQNNKNTSQ